MVLDGPMTRDWFLAYVEQVLAPVLTPGDVVILSGPLGAGKTSLTQGLAAALDGRAVPVAQVATGPYPQGGEVGVTAGASSPRDDADREQRDRDGDHDEQGAFAAHARTPVPTGAPIVAATTASSTVAAPRKSVQRTSPGRSRPRYGEFTLRPWRSPRAKVRTGAGSYSVREAGAPASSGVPAPLSRPMRVRP